MLKYGTFFMLSLLTSLTFTSIHRPQFVSFPQTFFSGLLVWVAVSVPRKVTLCLAALVIGKCPAGARKVFHSCISPESGGLRGTWIFAGADISKKSQVSPIPVAPLGFSEDEGETGRQTDK